MGDTGCTPPVLTYEEWLVHSGYRDDQEDAAQDAWWAAQEAMRCRCVAAIQRVMDDVPVDDAHLRERTILAVARDAVEAVEIK